MILGKIVHLVSLVICYTFFKEVLEKWKKF